MEGETITNTLDEVEFLIEVDGADFEFDAAEALLQFLLHTTEHLLVIAHPDEAVDGNAYFATREGGIEETVAILEIEQRHFQAKEH